MTLMEGIRQQGRPYRIEGATRWDLPGFFAQMGYKVGAEIGVYKAEFTVKLCQAGLMVYGIDPWTAYLGTTQERQDFLFGHASRAVEPHDCILIRKSSMEAVDSFEDGSLDFVFIDGDHAFKPFAGDIVEWERKVRKGGAVSGHDYFNSNLENGRVTCQVGVIVDAYTRVFSVDPWFVFGELDPEREPNRKERFLSWMWIK